jgi:MoxR-like ATPase
MGEQNELHSAAESLRAAIEHASKGLVDRKGLVETIALAAVAREHVLVIGPPGTAKSEAVRRMAKATGGNYFEYLIGRFTEPSEIFGPVDLRKLREGLVETQTGGMLPEAEIAFLDEIFLGSTAILNTLLGILQERVFRRGHTQIPCPLRICVGASNRLPESEQLQAFADRFLVHIFTDPISDSRLEDLLSGGWSADGSNIVSADASMQDIDRLAEQARKVDLSGITMHLAHAIRQMRSAGVILTDRRVVKMQRLLAAAATLDGRTKPSPADIWTTILAVPSKDEQALARECLKDFLDETENKTLSQAAEEVSRGPLARAARIVTTANELLANGPAENYQQWLLKLEGMAREIDAGFAPGTLPEPLAAVRALIMEKLQDERAETHSFVP